jgi:hypothetical protein
LGGGRLRIGCTLAALDEDELELGSESESESALNPEDGGEEDADAVEDSELGLELKESSESKPVSRLFVFFLVTFLRLLPVLQQPPLIHPLDPSIESTMVAAFGLSFLNPSQYSQSVGMRSLYLPK